jgi:hypothetical protein
VVFGGGFALGVVALLASTVEPSDTTGIRIELDAPPDCATAEAFYESVRRRTERVRPVIEGEPGVRVVVRLMRVGTRAHGELRVIGEHGESDTRRVDGNTCTEVVDALSLTVALAIDPTVHLAPPEPPPTVVVESTPPPVPPPEEPPPSPPPPERNLETRVGAAVVAMGQVTPYVSFGGELSLRFVMPWEAASSLGVAVIHIQNDLLSPADNASVRSTLFQLEACPARFGDPSALTLEPCLQGLGGWLGVAGRSVAHSESVTRSYFSLGGSLLGGAAFGKGFSGELSVGFAVPTVRRRFIVLESRRQIAETPSISAIGSLGLTYAF